MTGERFNGQSPFLGDEVFASLDCEFRVSVDDVSREDHRVLCHVRVRDEQSMVDWGTDSLGLRRLAACLVATAEAMERENPRH